MSFKTVISRGLKGFRSLAAKASAAARLATWRIWRVVQALAPVDARRIASSNASRVMPLVRNPTAPSCRALAMSLTSSLAEKTSIGNVALTTPEFLHCLQAVLVAHPHIQKKHVRLAGQRILDRFLTGFRLTDGLNLSSMYKLDDASTNCEVIIGNH